MTIVHRTPLDVARHELQGATRLPFERGLLRTTGSSAVVTSPEIEASGPFDRLVGSWNADVPDGAMLEMQAQVRLESGWSDWLNLGSAKGSAFHSAPAQETPQAFVDVDTLATRKPAAALRYRFLLSAPRRPIVLRLAAVSVSGAAPPAAAPFRQGPWVRELRVAPRSQREEQERYKNDVCSPTSLAMVMDFWGRRLETAAVAEAVRDRQTRIFGHWPFNAAFAGQKGLEAYVSYLSGFEELQDQIARGRPVVASLTFRLGELEGSPLRRTHGHLVVVAGFTPRGDVIVYDPAAPDRRGVRRIYDRQEFHRAWMVNKRGVAYLVGPLAGRRALVGSAVTDLMARPRSVKKAELHDADHLSQLLYGESVTIQQAKGDWARVLADEQPAWAGGRWQGYPGWVRAEDLVCEDPPRRGVNAVVRTRQALLQRGRDMLVLSVGTRLQRFSQDKGVSIVRLLGGACAEIASDSLYPLPAAATAQSRAEIVKTAELFLGTSYYWGGRSGVQADPSIGVDCSGLVDLAYRVHGADLPRDSQDQRRMSRPIRRSELRPADLVFLTEPGFPARISHVMIYTGGDGLIESRKSSGRVLRSSFKERFGLPLAKIRSGGWVLDHSYGAPRRRRIYFGTYF